MHVLTIWKKRENTRRKANLHAVHGSLDSENCELTQIHIGVTTSSLKSANAIVCHIELILVFRNVWVI